MEIVQSLLTILITSLVIIILLIGRAVYFFGKKNLHYFNKLFSAYELTQKKNTYMAAFYDEVYNFLLQQEARLNVSLSEEARQLLILPLIEFQKINTGNSDRYNRYYYERNSSDEDRNLDKWRDSIIMLMENIKQEPARIDYAYKGELESNQRSSISVIKAFANRFCNIPPFCGER